MESVESKPYLVHSDSPFDSNGWLNCLLWGSQLLARYNCHVPSAYVGNSPLPREWTVPASSMNKDEPCPLI